MTEVFIIVDCNNVPLTPEACRSKSKADKLLAEMFDLFYDLKPRIVKMKLV